jgi:hypothetical protein
MNLQELITGHALRPAPGLPDWMLGWFKRHSISFADGLTDVDTHVCWLQSRNFTIDLRLPRLAQQPSAAQGQALREGRLADITAETWRRWADFEGWAAPATWDGQRLSWHAPDASLQWHERWPEPAILHRVGQCMVERCDSGAYVEDWRLQPSAPGPLVGLHLLQETDAASGALRHAGGGWIVCGDHAALVLGRPASPMGAGPDAPPAVLPTLREHAASLIAQGADTWPQLSTLFDFETSVASLVAGAHRVHLSTRPERMGQLLCPVDGFTWLGLGDATPLSAPVPDRLRALPRVRQQLTVDGQAVLRLFAVDTLEPQVDFSLQTPCSAASQAWMAREAPTLQRYTAVLGDVHPEPLPEVRPQNKRGT